MNNDWQQSGIYDTLTSTPEFHISVAELYKIATINDKWFHNMSLVIPIFWMQSINITLLPNMTSYIYKELHMSI